VKDMHSLSHTKWNCKYHVVFANMYYHTDITILHDREPGSWYQTMLPVQCSDGKTANDLRMKTVLQRMAQQYW